MFASFNAPALCLPRLRQLHHVLLAGWLPRPPSAAARVDAVRPQVGADQQQHDGHVEHHHDLEGENSKYCLLGALRMSNLSISVLDMKEAFSLSPPCLFFRKKGKRNCPFGQCFWQVSPFLELLSSPLFPTGPQ